MFPGPPTVYQSILDHPDRDRYDLSIAAPGGHRRGRHPGRADPADARGAAVPPDRHRLRAHRGGHGDRHRARRRLRDHRHHRRARAAGTRDARGRRRRCRAPDRRGGRAAGAGLQRDARLPRRSRRDRGHRSMPTAGCTPATSATSTSAGACASSGGSRTCSSSVGSTPTRPRSRTCCSATLRWHGRPSSACPTSGMGEVGMAFVVVALGRRRSRPTSSIAWSRDAMANYKVPRVVELVDELPVNAAGKVEKETLRARCRSAERSDGDRRSDGHPVLRRAGRAAAQRGVARRRPRPEDGRRPRRRQPARPACRRGAPVGLVRAARSRRGRRSARVREWRSPSSPASSDAAPPTPRTSDRSWRSTSPAMPASRSRTRRRARCSTARCSTSPSRPMVTDGVAVDCAGSTRGSPS